MTLEGWKSQTSALYIATIRYDYDSAGRLEEVRELRGDQTQTPKSGYVYTYDDLDRLLSVTDTSAWAAYSGGYNAVAPAPVTLTYTYNADGDLASTQAAVQPVGETSPLNDFLNEYTYDGLGRLTELVQSGTAGTNQPVLHRKKVELSYNSAGRYSEIVRSQGASGSEVEVATGTYSYFDGGAMEEIAYDRSGTGISGYAWTYDNVGRVSTFTAPEGTFTYGYDGRGQLTSAAFTLPDTTSDPNRSEAFHHDPTGDFRDGLKSGDLSGV